MTLSARQMSVVVAALLAASSRLPDQGSVERVLFVGNSLTYTNDLPALLSAVAAAAGDSFRTASVTGPGLALIDHLTRPSRAAAAIETGLWDHVVLQQGPTSLATCRDSLILWTKMFDTLIRRAGGRPALFMTWPALAQASRFDEVRASYQAAALAVNGLFLPVGEAWRLTGGPVTLAALYGPDGFHPSPLGSLLAALTIYERLSGKDVRTLSPAALTQATSAPFTEKEVRALQRAAHEANTRFPEVGSPVALPPADSVTPALLQGHC